MKRLLKKQYARIACHKYFFLLQDKWVQKMNGLTHGISKKKLICYLFAFIILSAGFFLYNIYMAFSKNNVEASKNTFFITGKNYNK